MKKNYIKKAFVKGSEILENKEGNLEEKEVNIKEEQNIYDSYNYDRQFITNDENYIKTVDKINEYEAYINDNSDKQIKYNENKLNTHIKNINKQEIDNEDLIQISNNFNNICKNNINIIIR